MRRLSSAAVAALVLAGVAGPLHAQSTASPAPAAPVAVKPVDAAERRDVLERLAKTLEDQFVFPEVGARYAAMLRANLAAGAYDGLTDPAAFGAKITADLQAVASDGHLRLAPRSAFERPRPPAAEAPASTRATGPAGLEQAKMIGDVAYLRFNMFPADAAEPAARDARAFLLAHADAKGVILDSRPNRGGGMGVMDAILPLLYAQKTTLVRMDTRVSADIGDGPNTVRVASAPGVVSREHVITPDAGETRLQHVPVWYLTSRRSASAAEHLALAFKRTHRAVLVGETTRGAGRYGAGAVQPIGERFGAFIPVGRTYDPDTGWDWEGKGVAPDVAVDTQSALAKALELARAAGVRTE
jgi:hypothetical protein